MEEQISKGQLVVALIKLILQRKRPQISREENLLFFINSFKFSLIIKTHNIEKYLC